MILIKHECRVQDCSPTELRLKNQEKNGLILWYESKSLVVLSQFLFFFRRQQRWLLHGFGHVCLDMLRIALLYGFTECLRHVAITGGDVTHTIHRGNKWMGTEALFILDYPKTVSQHHNLRFSQFWYSRPVQCSWIDADWYTEGTPISKVILNNHRHRTYQKKK